jgi:beta-lactamase class A
MIDGRDVGGQDSAKTVMQLDAAYRKLPVNLYFGTSSKPYRQPQMGDIGLSVSTKQQVESLVYPFWLRLVPTSLWWAHSVLQAKAPVYTHSDATVAAYVQKELGQSCDVQAVNATVAYSDGKLKVVPAIDGGTCKLADVRQRLGTASPRLNANIIRIPMVAHPTKIHDGVAQAFLTALLAQTKAGVPLLVAGQVVTIPQSELLPWLDFAAPDSGITATVNADRANDFLATQVAPQVNSAAGVTRVTTLDFAEVARTTGASGQALDVVATAESLSTWLQNTQTQPVAKTKVVSPAVTYVRTYTPTDSGFAALLTQYAQSHSGTFGISYVELNGSHRHAGYNDTQIFETASTYKLFVAYGTLTRIESGAWHWSDQVVSGKDLTRCFNDMIALSDNACAEALLQKIGFSTLTSDIHALGLNNSSFMNSYIQSSPADLATYLSMLQSGQLLSAASTSTLIGAMKQNVYRQGIPAGSTGTVANKVGFLDPGHIQGVPGTVNLLHDAAIV